MKRRATVLGLVLFGGLLWACGGKVAFDSGGTATTSSSSSSSSGANACSNMPSDAEVQGLVGKSCTTGSPVCASNNGCGGCSVTCENGLWTSTNVQLCFSVGGTC